VAPGRPGCGKVEADEDGNPHDTQHLGVPSRIADGGGSLRGDVEPSNEASNPGGLVQALTVRAYRPVSSATTGAKASMYGSNTT
jgi:hypothetical protein